MAVEIGIFVFRSGSGEDVLRFEAAGKAKETGGTVRFDPTDVVVPEGFRRAYIEKIRRSERRAPTETEIAREYYAVGL